ncbi:MAG TPA: peptidoglycan DD-metalloendopeptidase family protein [bacterium]
MRPLLLTRFAEFLLLLSLLILGCSRRKEDKVTGKIHQPVVTTEFVQIKRNDHLQAALFRTSLDRSLALQIIDELKISQFPFRYCRPADSVYIVRINGEFSKFCYTMSPKEKYIVEKDSQGLICYMHSPYIERHMVIIWGKINSSLYETMLKMGETPELVYNFADIFAREIDFSTETQNGDSFEILVEKEIVDSNSVSYPKIFYVRYQGYVGDYAGIYFDDPEGYDDFYSLKGESLRKSLLKSPLRYSRISSYFSNRRFHPILRIWRPHHGLDYVAPIGTPVSSIGDGKITYAGWKGGYGNLVEIKHPNNYLTRYGHLSKIAPGIKVGKYVKMGDLIAYSGNTGLSTGPHLHFELHINNVPVNPLSIKIPRAPSVKKEYKQLFENEKQKILGMAIDLKKFSSGKGSDKDTSLDR